MKQLLIVNSGKAINAGLTEGNVEDLSGLQEGAITFFELGASTALSAPATKNFGIALGRPNGQRAFIIPEVDINTLTIVKALPKLGSKYKRTFTVPDVTVGEEYTVMFIKRATVPHERNTWHVSAVAKDTTPANVATALKTAIEDKFEDTFTVTRNSAKLTIEANNAGDMWEIKLLDGLSGVAWSSTDSDNAEAEPTIGDKAYVQDLASQCAAGKGFEHTAAEGREFIPGYPEAVEDLTPNTSGDQGASTAGYEVFTLRFKVGRDASKTRDERVWQLVHIALPLNNASKSTIESILPEGDFMTNLASSIADKEITTLVNSAYLD